MGDPELTKLFFGFDSQLVLGSSRVVASTAKLISGFDPLLS